MSDFFGKLKSGAGKVAFEADKMARLNRAQGEVNQMKHQVETLLAKLGETYYQNFVQQREQGSDLAQICQNITDLKQKIQIKGEEVQKIGAETYNPQGNVPAQPANRAPVIQVMPPEPVNTPVSSSPGIDVQEVVPSEPVSGFVGPQDKKCPNCGRDVEANVKFCPDCGSKL